MGCVNSDSGMKLLLRNIRTCYG